MTIPPEVALSIFGCSGSDLFDGKRAQWERYQEMRFGPRQEKQEKISNMMADFYREGAGWRDAENGKDGRPWWRLEESLLAENERRMVHLSKFREGFVGLGSDKV